MSEADPTESAPPAPADPQRFTLHHRGHRWSFAANADDAPIILRRLAELAADACAPLDAASTASVRNFFLLLSTRPNSPQPRPKNVDLRP